MRVIYVGNDLTKRQEMLSSGDDVLLLLYDRWDDFTYKTRFPTLCKIDGEEVELGAVKILISGEHSSHPILQGLLEENWDATFPIHDVDYISVPEEITFYQQLLSRLPPGGALEVAGLLKDASYLVHAQEDSKAWELTQTDGFRTSLLRERSSQKSFAEGWLVLNEEDLNVADLTFRFYNPGKTVSTLLLDFQSASLLPRDINVVIGPNGFGKSFLLRQIIDEWVNGNEDDSSKDTGFEARPNLSQVVVVSYSPFDRLPVDTSDALTSTNALKDNEVYRFFGFRGRIEEGDERRIAGSIRTGNRVPLHNSARSLVGCLRDDQRFSSIKNWANKLSTMQSILGTAMEFDFAAVALLPDAPDEPYSADLKFEAPGIITDGSGAKASRFVPITAGSTIDPELLAGHIDNMSGVTFFRNGDPIILSSGQRLFFYIVVNILGAIRRNSLIIVDEPELFLHPTLEVQFISMLKKILRAYGSKALLATHSVLTVREVPRECVHVIEQTDEGYTIGNPPFETFGGDAQRISSYVFGDRATSKPFEDWLRRLLEEKGGAQEVIEALGDEVNEEIIIQLHAMENGKW